MVNINSLFELILIRLQLKLLKKDVEQLGIQVLSKYVHPEEGALYVSDLKQHPDLIKENVSFNKIKKMVNNKKESI